MTASFDATGRSGLTGNGLPRRWAGRRRFVVLDAGFGVGADFLACWAAWRDDPQRCATLHYIAITPTLPTPVQLRRAHADGAAADLAAQLIAAWPPLTPNMHRLAFESGRLQLLLLGGDLSAALRELVADVDAFLLDGVIGAAGPPRDLQRLGKRIARIAAAGATATLPALPRELLDGLLAAGFVGDGAADTAAAFRVARFAPRFVPKRAPSRRVVARSPQRRDVLVLGAGLAGCATVAALAEQGWQCTLVDRHPGVAAEGSGNPAGLFHGVVHSHDGHHARFNRAAALEATRAYRQLIADAHRSGLPPPGAVDGLLRLGSDLPDVEAMQRLLRRLGLPADFVRALGAGQATELAGIELTSPAWLYPGGGWMNPQRLARQWLAAAGAACRFIGGVTVDRIVERGGDWVLLDRDGAAIASAPQLVLANAAEAPRLLDGLAQRQTAWPLSRVRGQLSHITLPPGLAAPKLPLTGAGFVLPALAGQLIFGATAQPDDDCAELRAADHQQNIDRLALLSPALAAAAGAPESGLDGRTGWRCVADDRLPLIGAVPAAWTTDAPATAADQPRFVARRAGLFLFVALGSRGITWAPLGAQVLAAIVAGAPLPLEAGLLDAIDPARFASRATRRLAADSAARLTGAAAPLGQADPASG